MLTGTLDQHMKALVAANLDNRAEVFGRYDAEKDGMVLAEFAGPPRHRLRGFVEMALPLQPSVGIHVHHSPRRNDRWSAVWLYSGTFSGQQHAALAERLAMFDAHRIVTKGVVDVPWGGFYCWADPDQPERVSAQGNLACGEATQRYSAEHIDTALLAALRAPVRDPAWV